MANLLTRTRSTSSRSLTTRRFELENLEVRKLMTADTMAAIEDAPADVQGGDFFTADSFSFGVEREMKESGEKGGTADLNIGIGELQEVKVAAVDQLLAEADDSAGTAEIEFVEVAGEDEGDADGNRPLCYLKYKLDRAFVKSWSISGDADDRPTEEVAFYYNKIAFGYAPTTDGTTEFGR